MSCEVKITEAFLKRMQALAAGKKLNASVCKDKLCEEMLQEGILVSVKSGRGMVCYASDSNALRAYLVSKDDAFRSLESDSPLLQKQELRSEYARSTGNSKIQKVRSCKGFLVNSYEPIDATLNGSSFMVNPPEGTFVFVADYENFKLPADVIVVGIENMENFRYVARQKNLFETLNKKILFVSRYPQSLDLVKWLSSISNRYIHFGDFDLAGVHIYLTEFYAKIGPRASFLIPQDVEEKIANGSMERYDDQTARFESMKVNDARVQPLVDLIKKYRKGYDQEGYIK